MYVVIVNDYMIGLFFPYHEIIHFAHYPNIKMAYDDIDLF